MKMEVPQVDLPLEVLAWTKVTEDILNIYKQSCRLQACIFAICTEGTMKVSINLLEYEVHPNDLITLLPGTIIQFREKEICRKLIQLITEHYKDQRCAQFYADQLGISLQHLSTTVKQVTGKSVLDTIAYIVIIDAKAQLKGTDMTIQEIAYSLNFPNPSFFCKFFRRHVGMSPLEFRNS